jgi:nucleotide-binding universal stress UspA family protein
MTLNRILSPIDFSEHSRHAVDHAIAIGRWYGGHLTALHMVPVPPVFQGPGPSLEPPPGPTVADLESLTARARQFIRDESGDALVPPPTVEVTVGRVAHGIVSRATTLTADLIIMGTHGRSGFDRLVLGSVTERVLRTAPCPVLTVPPRTPDAVPGGPAPYRRILCAVDFSPSSERALAFALSLGGTGATRVTVAHVVEVTQILEPTVIGVPDVLSYTERLRADRRERLRRFIATHTPEPRYVEAVLGECKAYADILRIAADERCDLIAIGVHGGLASALAFGSTVNQVVRHATCPVLTVRA